MCFSFSDDEEEFEATGNDQRCTVGFKRVNLFDRFDSLSFFYWILFPLKTSKLSTIEIVHKKTKEKRKRSSLIEENKKHISFCSSIEFSGKSVRHSSKIHSDGSRKTVEIFSKIGQKISSTFGEKKVRLDATKTFKFFFSPRTKSKSMKKPKSRVNSSNRFWRKKNRKPIFNGSTLRKNQRSKIERKIPREKVEVFLLQQRRLVLFSMAERKFVEFVWAVEKFTERGERSFC